MWRGGESRPVAGDLFFVHDPTDERGERRIAGRLLHGIKTRVAKVANARGKAEPQQVTQGENVIGESAGVGVMLFDAKIGFMIEQPIKDMGRVPRRGADEFAVEWGVLVGDVSVERRARLIAITGID